MRKFFFLILLSLVSIISLNSQIIYSTEYKYDADKIIYFTDYKYDADLIIYFSKNKYDAKWMNAAKKHLLY